MNSLSTVPAILEVSQPPLDILDWYQERVADIVVYDEGGRTVRGLAPLDYSHAGLQEELAETIGEDRINPTYNRLGALAMLESGYGSFTAGETSDLARELHQKEFGDVSWYLALRLHVQSITMSEALASGVAALEQEKADCNPEQSKMLNFIEAHLPFVLYFGYAHQTLEASRATTVNQVHKPELVTAAGKLILSMNQLCQVRLATSYETVLHQNITKLQRRIANGTIFDKSGGDIR